MTTVVLLGLALLAQGVPGGAMEGTRLQLGKSIRGSLVAEGVPLAPDGPSRRYGFLGESSGSVTVDLESYDFDALLRVENESGETIASADGGGIGTNARIVFATDEGAKYWIVAASADGGGGAFDLSLVSGDPLIPSRVALADAEIDFHRTVAEMALARGDRKMAARHLLDGADRLYERSRFAEAKEAGESALTLAQGLADRELEARVVADLSRISLGLAEYSKALEFAGRHLDLAKQLEDPAGQMTSLERLATASRELRDYSNSIRFSEEHLGLARAQGARREEAGARVNLGSIRRLVGKYPEATEDFTAALDIYRDMDLRRDQAAPLGNLGAVAYLLGKYAEARDYHEQALAVDREFGNRIDEAAALLNLGNDLDALGDPAGARSRYEEALTVAQEIQFRAVEAQALLNLGAVSHVEGDYPKARELYEKAFVLAKELSDRGLQGLCLANLGLLCSYLGEFSKAREYAEEHFELARNLGEPHSEVQALVGLGAACMPLGELAKAKECYETALDLAQQLGEPQTEATVLSGLGNLYVSLGDYDRARECHEADLALVRSLGDRVGEARALVNLGNLFLSRREFARAQEILEQAVAAARTAKFQMAESTALTGLGVACQGQGNLTVAREHFERRLTIAQDMGDRAAESRTLVHLGSLALWFENYAGARDLARKSMEIHRAIGFDEPNFWALFILCAASVGEGDAREAGPLVEQGESLLDGRGAAGLEGAEAAGDRSQFSLWGEVAQDYTALCVREAGVDASSRLAAVEHGFYRVGGWKARSVLEGLAEHRRGGRTAEGTSLRRERREVLARRDAVLRRLSQAIQNRKSSEEVDVLRAEARSWQDKADAIGRSLLESSPRDAALDVPTGVEWQAVRSVLGEGAALVEYAQGLKRLYAYVVSEKGLAFVDLGECEAVERAAEEYMSCVGSLDVRASAEEIAGKGRALFDRLLAPVLEWAGDDVRRLVFVPTPALAALPFEALVMDVGPEKGKLTFADLEFVLDRYEVSYAPSSPVFVEIASTGQRPAEGRMLVLADPLYPTEPIQPSAPARPEAETLFAAAEWRSAPLPGRLPRIARTRNEALALAALLVRPEDVGAEAIARLSETRSGSLSSGPIEVHLGAEASRRRLAEDLKRYAVVHLAVHGYVDREFPQRTGLALAFAEGEDGYFTIADTLELDLDADLVVLSGCETARGEVRAGDGMESIARAFLYAGARGVVASLWRVDDRSAAETMERFYRGWWEGGASHSRALREAKLAVRRSKEARKITGPGPAVESGHPFFWAPFVYVGLPR